MSSAVRPVESVLATLRGIFWSLFAVSGVVNVLALTGAFYMLQIYDRVLTSYSVPTLVAFSILAAGLYAVQGVLDVLRGQVFVRIGARLDRQASPLAHDALLRLPLAGTPAGDAVRPVRDVETVRGFLSSQGPRQTKLVASGQAPTVATPERC